MNLTTTAKKLLVIGAGPKGVAIAAKSAALRSIGIEAPEIILVDPSGVGANWDGFHGYTTGRQPLGTSPEKDIGFPYSDTLHPRARVEMLRFSWQSYKSSLYQYSDWIDRGRPQPLHAEWAEYLRWVVKESSPTLIPGKVLSAKTKGDDQMTVHIRAFEEHLPSYIDVNGIVFTGPGAPIEPPIEIDGDQDSRVYNGHNYWLRAPLFDNLSGNNIAVIGGGETAASVVVDLLNRVDPSTMIHMITRHPIYSRGEGYQENKLYSKPEEWETLPDEHKREFIRRTDRGVISLSAVDDFRLHENICVDYRNVKRIRHVGNELQVLLVSNHDGATENKTFGHVIFATGFDPFKTMQDILEKDNNLNIFPPDTRGRDDARASIMRAVDHHLRVSLPHAETPYAYNIHAPMLASLSQGPGFPNLSCLGILSDRILGPYL